MGLLQAMMETVRKHQVNLRGVVSTVVVTTLVLEGWCASVPPLSHCCSCIRELRRAHHAQTSDVTVPFLR